MRVAILESIIMPAGHEVEFDRLLVNELKRQGHEPVLFVPENFPFKVDYDTNVVYLEGGDVVTYAGASKWKKPLLSLLREKRRRAWFNSAAKQIKKYQCDALIIPTATYRYIKSLLDTELKNAEVPVHLIFHGIGKGEMDRFHKQAYKINAYKNIYLDVISLRSDMLDNDLPRVRKILPPVFLPSNQELVSEFDSTITSHTFGPDRPLRLGFFGQFRKEKNINVLLDAFKNLTVSKPVHLLVQGATAKPEDGALFDQIAEDYKEYTNISFLHANLIGEDWDRALLGVDALLMPYGAERYRYHWSAMLYTAIGFNKPVLVSPEINPEVLETYHIGHTLDLSNCESIQSGLYEFMEGLLTKPEIYYQDLIEANTAYSHEQLISSILKIK